MTHARLTKPMNPLKTNTCTCPAKGVGVLKLARVQIPASPLKPRNRKDCGDFYLSLSVGLCGYP